ncbi:MAG: collagen-like protein [Treponema sp.]|nr:collagen-like protein [Treponema sp.]
MVCYLNKGLILEQAIMGLINQYFDAMRMDSFYRNFHIKATLNHPFALVLKEHTLNAADHFPVVVVSTYDDNKPSELINLSPQIEGIGLEQNDIDIIIKYTEKISAGGKEKERVIPGLFPVAESSIIQAIHDAIIENGLIYGFSARTYRRDNISLEIWAENAQLKNEIYEHLRLFVIGNLRHIMENKYEYFDIKIDDDKIAGQRSGAYNDLFDVILHGANITFDVNYAITQFVLDTEIKNPSRDLMLEVINHVKGYEGTTSEWIIGPGNAPGAGSAGTPADSGSAGDADPGGFPGEPGTEA